MAVRQHGRSPVVALSLPTSARRVEAGPKPCAAAKASGDTRSAKRRFAKEGCSNDTNDIKSIGARSAW